MITAVFVRNLSRVLALRRVRAAANAYADREIALAQPRARGSQVRVG